MFFVKDTGDVVVIAASTPGPGDSIREFNHTYDPNNDTAYIPASYGINSETSVTRLYRYEGISDGSGGGLIPTRSCGTHPPPPSPAPQ